MAGFELDFLLRQGTFRVDIAERTDAGALALFGPSGSGKTTIMEAIAGLRTPERGTIVINGRVLFAHDRHVDVPARNRRMGYVPQDVLLFPHMDVRANILYGANGIPRDVEPVTELLELHALMTRRVTSLSGGERQRVALARALMSNPDVLLLDEPMAAVDIPRRRRILDALLRIRDDLGVPLVYVAHSPDEVLRIADWVLVMEGGTVIARGVPADVITTR
jgi:molybdate transport system ATP-binding protein